MKQSLAERQADFRERHASRNLVLVRVREPEPAPEVDTESVTLPAARYAELIAKEFVADSILKEVTQ